MKADLDAKMAKHRAEVAEDDALLAIDAAYTAVDEAHYAVLHPTAVRSKADKIAAG